MNCKNTSLLCALLILFLNTGFNSFLYAQGTDPGKPIPWLADSSIFVVPTFSNPELGIEDSSAIHHPLRSHQGTDKLEKRQIKDSLNLLKRALYKSKGMSFKNDPDSIAVTKNFNANPVENFTPMDNAMAISPEGYIVSAVNANWCVFDTLGNALRFRTFKQLANDPNLNSQFFDPRVMYDPESERFIMVILHGIKASDSRILVFVSKDKNPLNGWHVYNFSGNPFMEWVFSDFPHLGVSADHVWVSVNLFGDQNLSFKRSMMLVLDKDELAQGAAVDARIYHELKTNEDKYVFSLVPANGHDGLGSKGMHFLSSQDRGGEELYLFYLDPEQGIQSRNTIKTGPYALPGDALQLNETTMIDGGDCRISGAFYRNGLIHFCLNTRGPMLRNSIYYGRVDINTFVCEARTFYSNKDLAYGSPVSFAAYDANRAVLIPLLYSSENDYPSIGYVYVDDRMQDYPLISIYTGQSAKSNTKNEVNRWGDYCTAVSMTNSNRPEIWFAASATTTTNRWQNFLVKLIGDEDSISTAPGETEIHIYPNPVFTKLKLELKLEQSELIEITLFDSQGKRIESIWYGVMTKGNNLLLFEPRVKASGLYYVRVISGKNIIHTETLFIE